MLVIDFLSQPVWQRLGFTLLHFLWQGTAIAVLVCAVVHLLKLRRGNARYAMYLVGFVAMTLCPLIAFVVLDVPAGHSVEPVVEPAVMQGGESVYFPPVAVYRATPSHDVLPNVETPPAEVTKAAHPKVSIPLQERISAGLRMSLPWALVAWMGGVIALSVRLLMGFIGVHRLRSGLEPLTQDLSGRVGALSERLGMSGFSRVFVSASAIEAIAVGYLRPMVLLPAAMVTQMPMEMLEAVIAHELAHIRRFDVWVNLLQRIVETLLFYHLAVWWLSVRLRSERELCCDELAVAATRDRVTYASALEKAGRARFVAKHPAVAVGLGQGSKPVLGRVRYVLGLAPKPQNSRFWLAGVVAVLFLGAAVALTILTLPERAEAKSEMDVETVTEEKTRMDNASAAPVWISLLPRSPVRSAEELYLYFWSSSLTAGEPNITSCELEIRSAQDNIRMARVNCDYMVHGSWMYRDELRDATIRRIKPLEDGEYLIAVYVNGNRCSNVAKFTVDSGFDGSTEPTLQLVPLAPAPGKKLELLGLRAVGPNPMDPALTNYALYLPELIVDGVPLKKPALPWSGPVYPLKPGQQHEEIFQLSRYQPMSDSAIDLSQEHTVKAVVGKYESASVRIGFDYSLELAWDEATKTIKSRPALPPLLKGEVVGPDGKAGVGYRIRLYLDSDQQYIEYSDRDGKYHFPGVSPGTYKLRCQPQGSWAPELTFEQFLIRGERTAVQELSLEGKYTFAGSVIYEDGSPAAGVRILGRWEKREGTGRTVFGNVVLTDDNGHYELAAPFELAEYIELSIFTPEGIPAHGSYEHMRVKGSRSDVDFVIKRREAHADIWPKELARKGGDHPNFQPVSVPQGWDRTRLSQTLYQYLRAEGNARLPGSSVSLKDDVIELAFNTRKYNIIRPSNAVTTGTKRNNDRGMGPLPNGLILTITLSETAGRYSLPQMIDRSPWTGFVTEVYLPDVKLYLAMDIQYGTRIDRQLLISLCAPTRWLKTIFSTLDKDVPAEAKGALLPGSELPIEMAMRYPQILFVGVCEALDDASAELGYSGVMNTNQRFKRIESLAGSSAIDNDFNLLYSYLAPNMGFPHRGRAIRKGEHIIWIILKDGDYLRGIKALADTPENRRAILAAVKLPDADALLEQLIGRLSGSDVNERAIAVYKLGEMGERAAAAVPHLVPLLDGGSDSFLTVSKKEVSSELEVGTMYIGGPFTEELLRSPSFNVSVVAAGALRKIGRPAVPALIEASKKEKGLAARQRICEILGDIRDPRAFDALLGMMADRSWGVSVRACAAIRRINHPDTVDRLIEGLKDKNKYLRQSSAECLGCIRDQRVFDPLIKALRDPDQNVRKNAAEALASINKPVVIEPLLEASKDESWYVRRWVARALAKVDDVRIMERLIEILGDEHESMLVRRAATRALGQKGDLVAAKPLIHFFKTAVDSGYDAQAWAVAALGEIAKANSVQGKLMLAESEPDIVGVLIDALSDDDRVVRWKVASGFVGLKDPRAVEPLIANLKYGDRGVREESVKALGPVGDARAVGPLVEILKDGYWPLRRDAAEALGLIGDPAALPALKKVLDDGQAPVRKAAAEAIARIEKVQKPDAKAEGEEDWGETVDGVQLRLRTEKLVWKSSEAPILKADVRNSGSKMKRVPTFPLGFLVEIDGLSYSDQVVRSHWGSDTWNAQIPLAPGEERTGVEISLDEHTKYSKGGLRGALGPGKHIIRVGFPHNDLASRENQFFSNPVEIEILPLKKKVAWGKVVNHLQLGLAFDEEKRAYAPGEGLTLRRYVRNTGDSEVPLSWSDLSLKPPSVMPPKTWHTMEIIDGRASPNGGGVHIVPNNTILLKPGETRMLGKTKYRDMLPPGKYRISQSCEFSITEKPIEDFPNYRSILLTTGELEFVVEPGPDTLWGQADVPWGEPVKGVQCRLRPDRIVWRHGETPTFKVDIRNGGKRKVLICVRGRYYDLRYGGQWYHRDVGDTWLRTLAPGQQHDGVYLSCGKGWHVSGGKGLHGQDRLELSAGKHTVQVGVLDLSANDIAEYPVLFISNPVEIEILSDDPAGPSAGDSEWRNQALENLTFGPVIERVVACRKGFPSEAVPEPGPMYLDLDTGTYVGFKALPTSEMIRSSGVDVYYEPVARGAGMWLTTSNLQLQPMSEKTGWDRNPEFVRRALVVASPYHLTPPERAPLAFMTRDGGIGILQILGFTKNRQGIRIRYKIAQNGATKKTDVEVGSEETWGQPAEEPAAPG